MHVLAFALPSLEEGHLEFVLLDKIDEWLGHELAKPEETASVLERFARLAPPGALRRCAPELAEAGALSGWFPSAKGIAERRTLTAFALSIDPHCANRIPLEILRQL